MEESACHPPVVKLMIQNSQYSEWDVISSASKHTDSVKDQYPGLPPPQMYHGFNQDVYDVSDPTAPKLVCSPTRTASYLPGVLILEGNRTYGRTSNRKRLMYKCVPDDRHLPHFLVPYDIIMDFHKAHKNKYVLFRFQVWTGEHPHGLLVETLGDVNRFEAFYEYQLYSKSLHSSVKDMTQRIKQMTQTKTSEEYFQSILSNPKYAIEDWTQPPHQPYVFSIDHTNTVDYDDGFSISPHPTDGGWCVTVYVAHVVFWLEEFQLWDSFDNRISTIYLPDRRRPMLPSILSESLCSLKENTRRFALAFQFHIDASGTVTKTEIRNVMIRTSRNYVYDDPKMVYQDVHYMRLLDITVQMDTRVKNSRDLVAYWMVKTNTFMAQYMIQHKTGIFRVGKYHRRIAHTEPKGDDDDDASVSDQEKSSEELHNYMHMDEDTRKFIEYQTKAQSLCYDDTLDLEHEVLNKKAYLRITSVIRRYEDICNECELMRILGIPLREGWSIRANYDEQLCNQRYKSIRKVESESTMFHRTMMGEDHVMGTLYSRRMLQDGRYEYMVYVKGEGIKRIRTREKKELYKEYHLRRFIKERDGGLKLKMELDERLGLLVHGGNLNETA